MQTLMCAQHSPCPTPTQWFPPSQHFPPLHSTATGSPPIPASIQWGAPGPVSTHPWMLTVRACEHSPLDADLGASAAWLSFCILGGAEAGTGLDSSARGFLPAGAGVLGSGCGRLACWGWACLACGCWGCAQRAHGTREWGGGGQLLGEATARAYHKREDEIPERPPGCQRSPTLPLGGLTSSSSSSSTSSPSSPSSPSSSSSSSPSSSSSSSSSVFQHRQRL